MAPIMFGSLVIFLLLGYPVAFSLAANGLFFGLIGIELGLFRPDFLQALPERVYGVMNNETLLAIPFFTFMGLILERSGMAEDLLDTIGQLFGTIRGGLAYAVIFVGALLAATTGVVAASVISMGLIALPIMLRYGYDRRVATGVIAASGTLAQIIPPSLVLIVMADQLGRSVGDMYEGAFIPGLVLSAMYAGYVFLVTVLRAGGSAGTAARGTHLQGAGRTPRRAVACRADVDLRRDRNFLHAHDQREGRRRLRDPDHVRDHRHRFRGGARKLDIQAQAAVGAGRTGHLRDGAAACADLPCARHHFHRSCHSDRGRRDGRGWRIAARHRQAAADLRPHPSGGRNRPPSSLPS